MVKMSSNNIASYSARLINYIFHPILMPLYLFSILIFSSSFLQGTTIDIKVNIVKLVAIITVIIPLLFALLYGLIASLVGVDRSIKQNKELSSIVLIIFYIAGIFILRNYLSIGISMRLMCCPIFIIVILNVLKSFRIKISLSLVAMGALSSFLYIFSLFGIAGLNIYLFWSFILAGILASSKLYLNENSAIELGLGYIWGFSIAIVSFYLGGLF